jgi:hypothetical protein
MPTNRGSIPALVPAVRAVVTPIRAVILTVSATVHARVVSVLRSGTGREDCARGNGCKKK